MCSASYANNTIDKLINRPKISSRLQAYFPLAGDRRDYSGMNNQTQYSGGAFKLNGLQEQSINFTASTNYVQILANNRLQPTNALTLSLWVKPTQTQGSYAKIVSRASQTDYAYNLDTSSSGTKFRFYVANNTASSYYIVTRSTTIEVNKWVHLVCTFDGSVCKMYENGKLASTTATSAGTVTMVQNSNTTMLGMTSGGFIGNVKQFMLFDRALSAAEATELYNYQRFIQPIGRKAFATISNYSHFFAALARHHAA